MSPSPCSPESCLGFYTLVHSLTVDAPRGPGTAEEPKSLKRDPSVHYFLTLPLTVKTDTDPSSRDSELKEKTLFTHCVKSLPHTRKSLSYVHFVVDVPDRAPARVQ